MNPFEGFIVDAGMTSSDGGASVLIPLPSTLQSELDSFFAQWAVLANAACPDFGVDLSDGMLVSID